MHIIRLGPPWEVVKTADSTRHARRFGAPRTLDSTERLWLVCEAVPGAATVRVNDTTVAELTAPGPLAADITPLLRPRNEVVFVVASHGPLGSVTLEVHPNSRLR